MDNETPGPCECPLQGYCQRFQRYMLPRSHYLCQTRSDYRLAFANSIVKKAEREDDALDGRKKNPGAGTVLYVMLKRLGFKSKPGCQCKKRAKAMNNRGISGK